MHLFFLTIERFKLQVQHLNPSFVLVWGYNSYFALSVVLYLAVVRPSAYVWDIPLSLLPWNFVPSSLTNLMRGPDSALDVPKCLVLSSLCVQFRDRLDYQVQARNLKMFLTDGFLRNSLNGKSWPKHYRCEPPPALSSLSLGPRSLLVLCFPDAMETV